MSRWQIRIAVLLAAGVVMGQLPVEASTKTASAVLETLAVKGRAPKTGYERSQFGPAWSDVDRNGCDTRNDILYRDLTSIEFKIGTHDCVVLSGILVDPYSGEKISFVRGVGSSMEVQIDHVVALSNAWQTGAFKLSYDKRLAFANDPVNLLAVKGSLNSQKGDGDAATWLPPRKDIRCAYVAQQIVVKAKYGLWVTPPEKAAMQSLLAKCPGFKAPTN
ncbi:HNH endonuclease [Actinobacteria bacterium IMCC26103]|nr:HNH endonuclease [Actinobacteria bacterium IMCC26103]